MPRTVCTSKVPLRDENGEVIGIIGVGFDITERKLAEQRLAASEHLESIGRLAAGVAHEINTPIQYLNDSVYFIRDAMQDLLAHNAKLAAALPVPPEADEDIEDLKRELPPALDRVVDGLARIAEIVRSMKEFSHVDQREMSRIDLNRAINSTLVIARSEYKYIAELKTDFQDLPLVTCHGGQVNQVVLNLVVNAAHAIADKNKAQGTTEKGLITVTTRIEDGFAVISIGDTGGGIPEAIRKRIFEPFFTTKEVGRGTGQGLSIAHNVIKAHGGKLDFVTEIGKGTTFNVRLPLGDAEQRIRRRLTAIESGNPREAAAADRCRRSTAAARCHRHCGRHSNARRARNRRDRCHHCCDQRATVTAAASTATAASALTTVTATALAAAVMRHVRRPGCASLRGASERGRLGARGIAALHVRRVIGASRAAVSAAVASTTRPSATCVVRPSATTTAAMFGTATRILVRLVFAGRIRAAHACLL